MRLDELIGPRKRRTARAVIARRSVIAELYDPTTAGKTSHGTFAWGAAEIGRQLGLDHTTIIYTARKMGLRP